MLKSTRNRFISKPLIIAAVALTTSISATADDLDVFDAVLASQTKPNILFVLDYSGSMKKDVNGDDIPSGSDTLSKITILQDAVDALLESNKGKVNVGLGSLYSYRASGVRWPISDLEENASNYDSEIEDGVTVADVISSQLTRTSPGNATATVNALAEAAAYFRGDDVLHADKPLNQPYEHKPDRWNGTKYTGGNRFAAMPSSYDSPDAYVRGSNITGNYGWCTNYVGGDQQCEGRTTFDCVDYDEGVQTWSDSADDSAGSKVTDARTSCKFQHPDSFTTPKYKSPLTQACQANFIVLISDGEPSRRNNNTGLQNVLTAAGVTDGDLNECSDLSTSIFKKGAGTEEDGNCGPELLHYLATNDINPDIPNSNVKTFTVGFSLEGSGEDDYSAGKAYLELLAEKGEGEFFEAGKPEELTVALNNVLDSILAGSQSFAELSIDVDPTSFSHDNRTYFSLFSPNSQSSWEGNLKGYYLDNKGLVDVNGTGATIQDESGLRLSKNAQSFWSSTPDGGDVGVGGASESITELPDGTNSRNIYTYLGGAGTTLRLNADAMLTSGNDAITDAMLGNPGAAVRAEALDWLANAPMGDPLHTKPVVVNYGATKVVYIMTNQGLLHGFDATIPNELGAVPVDLTGGAELFAFMPQELLKNLPALYEPTQGADHIYGLDGGLTRWHDDINSDGVVNGEDTVMLVFGMRRGGSSYYALDVTDHTSPVFKWQINSDDVGFSRLAQTWSRASLVTVNNNDDREKMLMFGGGYDAEVVDGTLEPTTANGNAIFMVDSEGGLVWSVDETDHTDMIYSIPSDLTIIDSDRDGAVDRAYFGDLGGQVWRIDFDDVAVSGDVDLTKFADLDNGDHQPIFYKPSVSTNRQYGDRFLAISFGTGDRTQPMLDSSENAFYMLRDTDYEVGVPDSSFSTITATSIYDATANNIGSDVATVKATAKAAMKAARGWSVSLNTSEKSLSQVVSFEGKFLATTFEPATTTDGDLDQCSFNMIGRLYVMDILDARPVEIMDNGQASTSSSDPAKRKSVLGQKNSIPSSPVIVFPNEDAPDRLAEAIEDSSEEESTETEGTDTGTTDGFGFTTTGFTSSGSSTGSGTDSGTDSGTTGEGSDGESSGGSSSDTEKPPNVQIMVGFEAKNKLNKEILTVFWHAK